MNTFLTLGGRVQCTQCNSQSKRTKQQCRAPAIKGKTKCRFHGGKSTGPKTEAGRARIAAAHTVHGRETRQKRSERSAKLRELYLLEMLGRQLGFITGPKSSGRKPEGESLETECLSYLNGLEKEGKWTSQPLLDIF
jgi:hypothetical protein